MDFDMNIFYKTDCFARKTAIEWFSLIPFDNAREKAIKTFYRGGSSGILRKSTLDSCSRQIRVKHNTLSDAIFYAFIMNATIYEDTAFFERLWQCIVRMEKSIKLKKIE